MTDFNKIEILFAEFLEHTNSLTSNERCEVQDFIDHREYGLALETLVDLFIEGGKTPPPELLSTVTALADCMSMDTKSLLDSLRQSK